MNNDSSPTSSNKNDVMNMNLEHIRCKIWAFPTIKTTTADLLIPVPGSCLTYSHDYNEVIITQVVGRFKM